MPADLGSLVELRHRLQDHMKESTPALFDLASNWRARKLAYYHGCLEDPDRHLVVLGDRREEAILGMGLSSVIFNSDLEPARFGKIDDVWIEPRWRRQGLGSLIVAELLRFFHRRGIDRLTLSYAAGNRDAEAFWSKLGFQPALVMASGLYEEVKSSLVHG